MRFSVKNCETKYIPLRSGKPIAYFRAFSSALFNLVAIARQFAQTNCSCHKQSSAFLGEENARAEAPFWWPFKAIWSDCCQFLWQSKLFRHCHRHCHRHRHRHRHLHRQNSKRPKTLCGFSSCSFCFHCGFSAAVLWPARSTFLGSLNCFCRFAHKLGRYLLLPLLYLSVHDLCCLASESQNLQSPKREKRQKIQSWMDGEHHPCQLMQFCAVVMELTFHSSATTCKILRYIYVDLRTELTKEKPYQKNMRKVEVICLESLWFFPRQLPTFVCPTTLSEPNGLMSSMSLFVCPSFVLDPNCLPSLGQFS